MTKTKAIPENGTVLNVNDDKVESKPIEISYTQAKKLVKREMSEKQKANVQKLVEANRVKWEQSKLRKEEARKKAEDKVIETTTPVVVKPKRIYKKRVIVEEEPESESEDETEIVYQKRTPKPKAKESVEKKITHKKELINQIDDIINQARMKKQHSFIDALNAKW